MPNVGARASVMFFKKMFMFPLSKVTKNRQKAMSKVRTIVCCSKYYQNDYRYQAKAPQREALASDNLALPLIFFNFLGGSSKVFIICENCPADHLKAENNRGLKGSFITIFNFVFFLYLKFGLMNCYYQRAPGRAQIRNSIEIQLKIAL